MVVHPHVAHVHRVVVSTGLYSAIKGVVLQTGHGVLRSVMALQSFNHDLGDATAQERVLAGAFGNASPTWVESDVDHRTIDPVDALRGSLTS